MIIRFLLSATLAVALQGQLHSARAAVFTLNDHVQAHALEMQMLDFMANVTDALKTAKSSAYECLNDMSYLLEPVSGTFHETTDLIGLSAKMLTPGDERTINSLLAAYVVEVAPHQIANSRSSLYFTARRCGQDNIVNAKVRQALDIFSRLEGFYGTLQSKLGTTQR